jgi:glycosyltransferase involved in cell wall biosynthesis
VRKWNLRRKVTTPVRTGVRRVLIVVQNLPVPFDRRVWSEALALRNAGYTVSIISPKAKGYEDPVVTIDDIQIYRHGLPFEASGALGYFIEYSFSLFWQLVLTLKAARRPGFDVIHACNPPDLIFIVGVLFKFFGRKNFVFDHHDLNPELYESKFQKRGLFWRLLVLAEKLTFKTADVSIATNESYRRVAITRGGMPPDRTFVVRSGPNLERVKQRPPDPGWRKGRHFLVGYVGVISEIEGIDLLLAAVDHIVRTRRRNDVQFVIAGSGPSWSSIVKQCDMLGLNEYVTLTGRIEDAALFSMLSTADVCVNPDRVTPLTDVSTMNKVMEYMALGKPIVQFDVIEGRFSAQDASLYARPNDSIDFGDKILQLLESADLRQQMGEFGRCRVNEVLAWQHEQPKLLAAYDALFALRERPASAYQRLRSVFIGKSSQPDFKRQDS